MSKNDDGILGLLALTALLTAAQRKGDNNASAVGLDDLLAGRQKGEPVEEERKQTAAELLDDPHFQEWARRKGLSLTEVTPGCSCEMCTEIARRNEAKAKCAEDERYSNTMNFSGAEAIPGVNPFLSKTVPEILREAALQYEHKNPLYGDAYKQYGSTMMSFFPQGLYINEPEDWNRFGLFSMMVSKMNRIAANLTVGGHYDSSLDLSTYAAMSAELSEIK